MRGYRYAKPKIDGKSTDAQCAPLQWDLAFVKCRGAQRAAQRLFRFNGGLGDKIKKGTSFGVPFCYSKTVQMPSEVCITVSPTAKRGATGVSG